MTFNMYLYPLFVPVLFLILVAKPSNVDKYVSNLFDYVQHICTKPNSDVLIEFWKSPEKVMQKSCKSSKIVLRSP